VCQADGSCGGGTVVIPSDDANPCTEDTCDPKSGATLHYPLPGQACDDQNQDTVDDRCVCDDGDPATAPDACKPDGSNIACHGKTCQSSDPCVLQKPSADGKTCVPVPAVDGGVMLAAVRGWREGRPLQGREMRADLHLLVGHRLSLPCRRP